jgi:SOS response regulatory protein OraA/RecX
LAARGLLDDLECARGLVEGVWRRRGYGRLRIRAELQQRGVAEEIIDTILSERSGDEVDLAVETARRWRRGSDKGRDALARHLGRKGYSGEVIYEVLARLEGELGEG